MRHSRRISWQNFPSKFLPEFFVGNSTGRGSKSVNEISLATACVRIFTWVNTSEHNSTWLYTNVEMNFCSPVTKLFKKFSWQLRAFPPLSKFDFFENLNHVFDYYLSRFKNGFEARLGLVRFGFGLLGLRQRVFKSGWFQTLFPKNVKP